MKNSNKTLNFHFDPPLSLFNMFLVVVLNPVWFSGHKNSLETSELWAGLFARSKPPLTSHHLFVKALQLSYSPSDPNPTLPNGQRYQSRTVWIWIQLKNKDAHESICLPVNASE